MGDSLSEHRPPSGSFPEMPQSTPEMILDTSNSETDEARSAIRLNVPQRYLVVPSVCALTGLSIGLMRGSREEGLRFLAENAHRAPTTVKGWYLYKKTKNYRMLWGGMKSGGKQALRLGVIGMTWAGLEDGMERVGAGEVKEVGAGLGTSILFSALYRLPMVKARQATMLGVVMGGVMSGMRVGQKRLEAMAESESEV